MGDTATVIRTDETAVVRHDGLRVVRGLEGAERELVLGCWMELWKGALDSQRERKTAEVTAVDDRLEWCIRLA